MVRKCLKCNREFNASYYGQTLCSACHSPVPYKLPNQVLLQSKFFVGQSSYLRPLVERKPETSIKPLPVEKPIENPAVLRQEFQENNKPPERIIKRRTDNPKSVYIGIRLTPSEIEPIANMNISKLVREALAHYIKKHLNKNE